MKKILTICLVVWLSNGRAQFSAPLVALKDVNVIDVNAGKLVEHCTVLIHDSKIMEVGPYRSVPIPDSATIINCTGKYLIPGLIDTHVHILNDVSGEDYRARVEKDTKAMLLSGITSVRDMAGDARALASFARDALVGDIDAPDVYYSSFFAGPSFFKDPRTYMASKGGVPGHMLYMREVTDSTNIPMAIAESVGTGATGIKLYAQLTGSLAKKLTAEAHRQGLQVWAHLDLTIASPLETINAGVNTVSHAGMIVRWRPDKKDSIPLEWRKLDQDSLFWDQQFRTLPVSEYIVAMKKHKTILDATLLIEKEGINPNAKPYLKAFWNARFELGRRFVKLALENGIPICTGTDVDENRFVQRELKTLIAYAGFTPIQAITSATKVGAMAIGIENKTGTIEKSKDADLVLLSANPMIDINNLGSVMMVMKKGKMYNGKVNGEW